MNPATPSSRKQPSVTYVRWRTSWVRQIASVNVRRHVRDVLLLTRVSRSAILAQQTHLAALGLLLYYHQFIPFLSIGTITCCLRPPTTLFLRRSLGLSRCRHPPGVPIYTFLTVLMFSIQDGTQTLQLLFSYVRINAKFLINVI